MFFIGYKRFFTVVVKIKCLYVILLNKSVVMIFISLYIKNKRESKGIL